MENKFYQEAKKLYHDVFDLICLMDITHPATWLSCTHRLRWWFWSDISCSYTVLSKVDVQTGWHSNVFCALSNQFVDIFSWKIRRKMVVARVCAYLRVCAGLHVCVWGNRGRKITERVYFVCMYECRCMSMSRRHLLMLMYDSMYCAHCWTFSECVCVCLCERVWSHHAPQTDLILIKTWSLSFQHPPPCPQAEAGKVSSALSTAADGLCVSVWASVRVWERDFPHAL